MKISTNTIRFINKHYGTTGELAPDGLDVLAEKIGAQLGAIEEIIDIGARYANVFIIRVVSSEHHPNADRLHVCKVDDGGKAQDVTRDEDGYVQVVCGAPNVRTGMKAVWLPPKATVPNTYDKEPFVLEAREIRGQLSNGMLASPKELGLGDNHEGILEVDADIEAGSLFAEAYNLRDDHILDIENKMFTHRPDCFGFMGVAREIAGIQQQQYKSPAWYTLAPEFPALETDAKQLTIRNELPDVVPRFTAIVLSNVQVAASPVWLQITLAKFGIRPINNIVDYTNFFMLETGQPLHAYDYDKVVAQDTGALQATIVVRHPKPGEKVALLNGKTIEPYSDAIMIATEQRLIGVGGVMGGADTEVDENTRTIILECATFDMYSIRRTSMVHGLFTDAVTRFNKGQSPLQNRAVLAKIVAEIRQFAGGKVASEVVDDNHLPAETITRGSIYPAISVTTDFINDRLGFSLNAKQISELLGNVEFTVTETDGILSVQAPFWRTDIEIPEDVVEEAGRLYGYDKLPLELPRRSTAPVQKDQLLEAKTAIRNVLSGYGANEVLTYSFVHGNLLDKVQQDRSRAFQLANALSPDLQYYRLSMLPSLLEKVHGNIKAGYDHFGLFEIGRVHTTADALDGGVPREANALGYVYAADQRYASERHAGASYYQARLYLDSLLQHFNVAQQIHLKPLVGADLHENPWTLHMAAPFEPSRSAVLQDDAGLVWGIIGEFKASVQKALKLPAFCAGFELDPLLFVQQAPTSKYVKLSRFPKVSQDICLKVNADIPYAQVFACVSEALTETKPKGTITAVRPVDIYKRQDDAAHRQITLRITIASYERTMTDDEVSKLLETIADAARVKLSAERI